jgi:hypothetical protein
VIFRVQLLIYQGLTSSEDGGWLPEGLKQHWLHTWFQHPQNQCGSTRFRPLFLQGHRLLGLGVCFKIWHRGRDSQKKGYWLVALAIEKHIYILYIYNYIYIWGQLSQSESFFATTRREVLLIYPNRNNRSLMPEWNKMMKTSALNIRYLCTIRPFIDLGKPCPMFFLHLGQFTGKQW